MPDDRRMTTDRFFGGVSNRIENLQAMLVYVQDQQPARDELNEWLRSHTQARSADSVGHHLAFLDSIDLINLSNTSSTLAEYGRRYLSNSSPKTIYEALSAGVKGFDTILEALNRGPMTDEEIMELLVQKFEEAKMTKPGPAIRHREWLQVLGYVERSDNVNHLTEAGREILNQSSASSSDTGITDNLPASRRIEAATVAYERIARQADAPELSSQTSTTSHWQAEQQMLSTYPEQLQSSGKIPSAHHLDNIVLWTQPVTVSHTREASEKEIQEQSAAAFDSTDPADKINHLTQIYGVGTAVATAILLFYNPERYTLMNNRSTAGLARWGLWPADASQDAHTYGEFLNICRTVSAETGFSLRDIDRALYVIGGPNEDRSLISEILPDLPPEGMAHNRDTKSTPSMSKLRQQAVEAGEENVESFGTTAQEVTSYNRSTAVREYVMARADGYCEACGNEAPFAGTDGKPYLQAHHINELGTGGEDTIENVIALCPNCHYRVHHGLNGEQFNQMLAEYLLNIE